MAFIEASPMVRQTLRRSKIEDRRHNCGIYTTRCAAEIPRRAVVRILGGVASGVVLSLLPTSPGLLAEEKPGLPAGAREFSRLLAAHRQWGELDGVLSDERELESKEWESLRAYIRTIYQASADMDFLAKGWDKGLRGRGDEVIKRFRVTVKGMDKPASAKDKVGFREMYMEASRDFDGFFELLKEASAGDVPDEL